VRALVPVLLVACKSEPPDPDFAADEVADWGCKQALIATAEKVDLLPEKVQTADPALVSEADNEKWDTPIVAAMEVAYAFGGPKTQTPTIVIGDDPPHGFKGPVMAPAPTGDEAVKLWDALQTISRYTGFFEITRPRANKPVPPPP